jgi:hypothetical protein
MISFPETITEELYILRVIAGYHGGADVYFSVLECVSDQQH